MHPRRIVHAEARPSAALGVQPETIAYAILYAARAPVTYDRGGEATIGFALGNKLVPDLMDWIAGSTGMALLQLNAGPDSPVAMRAPNPVRPGQG